MSRNIKIGVKTLNNKEWLTARDSTNDSILYYFYDTSDANVSPSDVAQGKIAYTSTGRIIGTGSGGGAGATLNPASITISNDILHITDGNNGTFTTGFEIYADGVQKGITNLTEYDLSNLDLAQGNTYSITVKVYGTNMTTSNDSNSVAYSPSAVSYPITVNLTNLYNSQESATTIVSGQTANVILYSDSGFYVPAIPDDITVVGAEITNYSVNNNSTPATCTITLGSATGNVSITAAGTSTLYYGISYAGLVNLQAEESSAKKIARNGTAYIVVFANEGYKVPATVSGVSVSNATISDYSADNTQTPPAFIMRISNPTGYVTINASGVFVSTNFILANGDQFNTSTGDIFNVSEGGN